MEKDVRTAISEITTVVQCLVDLVALERMEQNQRFARCEICGSFADVCGKGAYAMSYCRAHAPSDPSIGPVAPMFLAPPMVREFHSRIRRRLGFDL